MQDCSTEAGWESAGADEREDAWQSRREIQWRHTHTRAGQTDRTCLGHMSNIHDKLVTTYKLQNHYKWFLPCIHLYLAIIYTVYHPPLSAWYPTTVLLFFMNILFILYGSPVVKQPRDSEGGYEVLLILSTLTKWTAGGSKLQQSRRTGPKLRSGSGSEYRSGSGSTADRRSGSGTGGQSVVPVLQQTWGQDLSPHEPGTRGQEQGTWQREMRF